MSSAVRHGTLLCLLHYSVNINQATRQFSVLFHTVNIVCWIIEYSHVVKKVTFFLTVIRLGSLVNIVYVKRLATSNKPVILSDVMSPTARVRFSCMVSTNQKKRGISKDIETGRQNSIKILVKQRPNHLFVYNNSIPTAAKSGILKKYMTFFANWHRKLRFTYFLNSNFFQIFVHFSNMNQRIGFTNKAVFITTIWLKHTIRRDLKRTHRCALCLSSTPNNKLRIAAALRAQPNLYSWRKKNKFYQFRDFKIFEWWHVIIDLFFNCKQKEYQMRFVQKCWLIRSCNHHRCAYRCQQRVQHWLSNRRQ